jgi:hypothetical protein
VFALGQEGSIYHRLLTRPRLRRACITDKFNIPGIPPILGIPGIFFFERSARSGPIPHSTSSPACSSASAACSSCMSCWCRTRRCHPLCNTGAVLVSAAPRARERSPRPPRWPTPDPSSQIRPAFCVLQRQRHKLCKLRFRLELQVFFFFISVCCTV